MKETVQVTRGQTEAAQAFLGQFTLGFPLNNDERHAIAEVMVRFARLSATSAPAGVEGWKLVPVEPTEAMHDVGYDATRLADGTPQFSDAGFCLGHAGVIYRAMIAAAPAPSGQEVAKEPFGYWIEQKGAEPALLRKPAYIPEPSDLRTVTPLYATPPASGVTVPDECQFCLGAKGGVNGNENVINGVIACDYCSALLRSALSTPSATPGEEAWPTDGTCRLCGSAPRSPITGLCATCTDEAATATPGALDPATVERLAASLCDNPDARLIAGQEDAPAFEDSSPHVQSYWRALAEHLATDPHQHGGKGA